MLYFVLCMGLLIGIGLSCNKIRPDSTSTEPQKSLQTESTYQLIPVFNGIYIEFFDSTVFDQDRYNRNNRTFVENSVFEYSYSYYNSEKEKYLFNGIDSNWKLVPKNQSDSNTIKSVILKVPSTYETDYHQTIIQYYYPPNESFTSTGVIENEKNIWLHPPRDGLFRILQLNPFPYVKEPLEIGNNWNWSMKIGSQYADKRWKEWYGTITNNYNYEVVSKRRIKSPLGRLLCYEIRSFAESELGKTSLIAFFNREFGFVKLIYTNIDQSVIEFTLTKKVLL
jgi:hypothetical protein